MQTHSSSQSSIQSSTMSSTQLTSSQNYYPHPSNRIQQHNKHHSQPFYQHQTQYHNQQQLTNLIEPLITSASSSAQQHMKQHVPRVGAYPTMCLSEQDFSTGTPKDSSNPLHTQPGYASAISAQVTNSIISIS